MPPQTRATRATPPASRVYESPQLPQQAKFKPRRQRVYGRHSLGSVKAKRQETLTQIGFVRALSDREIDEEIEAYEMEEKARGKRRKTMTPSSRLHTQTLTQLDFVSTPRVECGDSQEEEEDDDEDEDEDGQGLEKAEEPEYENEDEGGQGPAEDDEPSDSQHEPPAPKRRPRRRGIITVRCIKVEPDHPSQSPTAPPPSDPVIRDSFVQDSPPHRSATQDSSLMPPPKTPTRKRVLEIPSSQSPATPLSAQRVPQTPRTHDERSPLKSRSCIPTSPDFSTQRIPQTPRTRDERSPLMSRSCNHTSPALPTSPIGYSKFAPFIRQSQISTQGITQDVAAAADDDDDAVSLVPASSPLRRVWSSQGTVTASQSPSKQVLSEFTAASSSSLLPPPRARISKVEIADSDADSDDEELETQETQEATQQGLCGAIMQVPSSPPPRDVRVASSPLRRPALVVQETFRGETQGESQWTMGGSQLLPDSLMGDSLLAVPPSLEDWEGEGEA